MKVTVKKKDNSIPVAISTEFIKLQDAMKYANIVYSGGKAKPLILEEQVTVNGEVCTMRGKKLRPAPKYTMASRRFVLPWALSPTIRFTPGSAVKRSSS